jgi:hypothetical protein
MHETVRFNPAKLSFIILSLLLAIGAGLLINYSSEGFLFLTAVFVLIPLLIILQKHRPVFQLDIILLAILIGPLSAIQIFEKTPNLFWADLVLALFSFVKLVELVVIRRGCLLSSGIERWVVLYILAALITLPRSLDFFHSLALIKLRIMPLLIFLLSYNCLRSLHDIDHLLKRLLLFGAILALMMGVTWSLYYHGLLLLEEGFGIKDMAQVFWGRNNYLASLFIILIPLGLSLLFSEKIKSFNIRILLIIIIISGLMITQSRGAIISLSIGLIFWLLLNKKTLHRPRFLMRFFFGTSVIASGVVIIWLLIPESYNSDFFRRFNELSYSIRSDPL